MALPVIFGCSGLSLTEEEKQLFSQYQPFGFILFKRNCESPEQMQDLCDALRACVAQSVEQAGGAADAASIPILIDQEGGRVMRMTPPVWPERPSMQSLCHGWENPEIDPQLIIDRLYAEHTAIAKDLKSVGVSVNCLPVLDVPQPGSDAIISDRALTQCQDTEAVVTLGKVVADAYLDHGIIPIMKHIPGHGRAGVDSHKALPVVDTDYDTLVETDFKPFKALAKHIPWAMTAHIVYKAIDPFLPATLSETVIRQVIRGHIGFEGILISDDLNMHALQGSMAERALGSLAAGCTLALHCSGDYQEMLEICQALQAVPGFRVA